MPQPRPPRQWKVLNVTRYVLTDILSHHVHTFGAQKVTCEFDVVGADIGNAGEHLAATEDLDLELVAQAAGSKNAVDQLFHRGTAIARAAPRTVAPCIAWVAIGVRQHEMIHAANAQPRMTDTCRNTGAQHSIEQLVLPSDVKVPGQQPCDELAGRIAI